MKLVPHQSFEPTASPHSRRIVRGAAALMAMLALFSAPLPAQDFDPAATPQTAPAAEPQAPAAATPAVGTPPIAVTYTGNEGFLIAVGSKKILVDALYREGVTGYVSPPAAQREKMETGQAPFDGVGLALSTHHHADHFHPEAVGIFLQNNPAAVFISTDQASQVLKKYFTGFAEIQDRVRGLTPAEGSVAQENMEGLDIQVFNLHHGRTRSVDNIAFLVQAGGRTIFHMGDTEATATDLSPLGLANKKIDLAFVPFWYLLTDGWKRAIRKQVAPQSIVVMHMPAPDADDKYINSLGGWDKVAADIKTAFPNATVFRALMESAQF